MAIVDKLKEKKRQLDARIKKIESIEKTKKRKEDTRRKIIIGAALMSYAAGDTGAEERLNKILGKFVTNPKDRAFLGLPTTAETPTVMAVADSVVTADTADGVYFQIKPDTDV